MCYCKCIHENYHGECTRSICIDDEEEHEAEKEFWQELKEALINTAHSIPVTINADFKKLFFDILLKNY